MEHYMEQVFVPSNFNNYYIIYSHSILMMFISGCGRYILSIQFISLYNDPLLYYNNTWHIICLNVNIFNDCKVLVKSTDRWSSGRSLICNEFKL